MAHPSGGATATHETSSRGATTDEPSGGFGWMLFAGTMILLVGTLNVIYGIAAIDSSKFYVRDVQYILGDLNTWGWILLIVGACQIVAGLLIYARNAVGRWVGIVTACVNAVVQLLFLPSFPLASLALFSIDVLVVYGLMAHGHRRPTGA